MVLIAILLGTLTAGIGSVWLAALLSFGVLARYTQHLRNQPLRASFGIGFLILFAFIGTFTDRKSVV